MENTPSSASREQSTDDESLVPDSDKEVKTQNDDAQSSAASNITGSSNQLQILQIIPPSLPPSTPNPPQQIDYQPIANHNASPTSESNGVQESDLGYEDDFADEVDDNVAAITNQQEDPVIVNEEPGDGMESYVEENRHLLEFLDNPDAEVEGQTSLDEGDNVDDQGDFIEADIPQTLYGYNSSNDDNTSKDSATSSYEDIPGIVEGENVNRDPSSRGAASRDSGEESGDANESSPSPLHHSDDDAESNSSQPLSHPHFISTSSQNIPFPIPLHAQCLRTHSRKDHVLKLNSLHTGPVCSEVGSHMVNGSSQSSEVSGASCSQLSTSSASLLSPLTQCRYCKANRQNLELWPQSQPHDVQVCDRNSNENLGHDRAGIHGCRHCNMYARIVDTNNDLQAVNDFNVNGLQSTRARLAVCETSQDFVFSNNGVVNGQENCVPASSDVSNNYVLCENMASNSSSQQNMLSPCLCPRASDCSENFSDFCSTSRHTSTSNCDGDENSFQDLTPEDYNIDCFECQRGISTHPPVNGLSLPSYRRVVNSDICALQRTRHSIDIQQDSGQSHVIWPNGASLGEGRAGSLPRSCSAELAQDQGLTDLYDPNTVNMQWLHTMTRSLDEDVLSSVLNNTQQSNNEKAGSENSSPSQRHHLRLYSKFLRNYLLTQLQDPHRAWWYEPSEEEVATIPRVMIWTEFQAYCNSVDQIGKSACGATAAINVLKALDTAVDVAMVMKHIKTKARDEEAHLPRYLFSRSVAGTTAELLLHDIETLTRGQITGRFFHLYPERTVCVRQWLAHWIKQGAVAVMTLNLQRGVAEGQEIPDAWHHQMVYGVSPKGVYLTNPQQLVSESVLEHQLSSPSTLLIHRRDILPRFTANTDLSVLVTSPPDPSWTDYNVLGQVVHMLRDARNSSSSSSSSSANVSSSLSSSCTHLSIPAAYRSGITLYALSNTPLHHNVITAPELPLKQTSSKTYLETEIF